jgi:hypothetical protein
MLIPASLTLHQYPGCWRVSYTFRAVHKYNQLIISGRAYANSGFGRTWEDIRIQGCRQTVGFPVDRQPKQKPPELVAFLSHPI